MTHTNHRRGDPASLRGEFILLPRVDPAVRGQLCYGGPVAARMRRLARIVARHDPEALDVRIGDRQARYVRGAVGMEGFCALGDLVDDGRLTQVRHVVLHGHDRLQAVLSELAAADLGISIVVSGLFDDVFRVCRSAGLEPHSVNMSLGTWGRTDLLPEGEELELTTMCGHGCVSLALVTHVANAAARGELAPDEAALELARPCVCNIVDVGRAARLLRRVAGRRAERIAEGETA